VNWVPELYGGTKYYIEHLDSIPWSKAPVPKKRHKCKAQTRGINRDTFAEIQRCACGAVKINDYNWIERNSRKK